MEGEREREREMKTNTKGVIFDAARGSRPFYFVIQKDKKATKCCFATEAEAAAVKRSLKTAQTREKELERAAHAEKRRGDVEVYGKSSEQERGFLIACQKAADPVHGTASMEFVVLNDGTLADCLVLREHGLYLPVQVKTTARKVKGKNSYRFQHVLGYVGMLVVFWVVDTQRAWIFDGTWLNDNGVENYLLTPGSARTQHVEGCLQHDLRMEEMLAHLREDALASHILLTTEDASRRNITSATCRKEFFGIEQYERFRPGDNRWPRDANGAYDRLRVESRKNVRVQHKHCCPHDGKAGLRCSSLGKCAGRVNGKRLLTCYAPDDADEYVFHWYHEPTSSSHFWVIPSDVLAARNYFTRTTGAETIYLYGPEGVGAQPNPNARAPANTWTRAYYAGSLKFQP